MVGVLFFFSSEPLFEGSLFARGEKVVQACGYKREEVADVFVCEKRTNWPAGSSLVELDTLVR